MNKLQLSLIGGVAAVSLMVGTAVTGFSLANDTAPTITPAIGVTAPTATVVPIAAPEATLAPTTIPEVITLVKTVEQRVDNHENRITALEQATLAPVATTAVVAPSPTPTPTPVPPAMSCYANVCVSN